MGIEKYSPTAANNNATSPNGFPENMRPSEVNDTARQVLADLRSWADTAEWIPFGANANGNAYSISYVSATVFKFPGTDRRDLCTVHRRVRAAVGAGIIYGTVTDSSLSASDTQITVAWDSGSLDTSLSGISVGILNPSNDSIPRNLDASFSDVAIAGDLRALGDTSLSDAFVAGRLASVYAARAWGYVTNAAGTPALAASLGTSGISDVGQGLVQIKLSISMTSSDYAILATQDSAGAARVSARSKTEFTINTRDFSLSATDVHFNYVVFGTQ